MTNTQANIIQFRFQSLHRFLPGQDMNRNEYTHQDQYKYYFLHLVSNLKIGQVLFANRDHSPYDLILRA